MKFNFRKIASVLASVVMLGSTVGIAAAANYPAPFVSGGAANVAVVYGSSAAFSDGLAAGDLQSNLQAELAKSSVNVDIKKNEAQQVKIQAEAYQFKREAEGRGDSSYVTETGKAKGAEIEAVGLARAKAAEELRKAVGEQGTTLVNAIDAVMKGDKKIMPDILVAGGNGSMDGLAATLMKFLSNKGGILGVKEEKKL